MTTVTQSNIGVMRGLVKSYSDESSTASRIELPALSGFRIPIQVLEKNEALCKEDRDAAES